MDRLVHREISADCYGPNAAPGSCVRGGLPPLLSQDALEDSALLSVSEALKIQPRTIPEQPRNMTDLTQTSRAEPESSPAVTTSISRPRPTALRTKSAPRSTHLASERSGEAPVFIPVPQSVGVLPHSKSESSFSLPAKASQTPPTQLDHKLPVSSSSTLSPQPQRIPSPRSYCPAPFEGPAGENKDFRVHIVTWNVGSAVPPDEVASLFGPYLSDGNTDMFIVGLQEVNSMINKRLKDALFSDQWSELCMDTLSPFGYVLVASQRMQGVLLMVFSKFVHLPFLRGVQTQSTRTGLGGYWQPHPITPYQAAAAVSFPLRSEQQQHHQQQTVWLFDVFGVCCCSTTQGNKGGVSARMTVFGHPVCFLNCHLPAHMRNLEQRMEDFESILQQQQFEGGTAPGVLDHDVVFWFGDLNFRIEDYDIHVVKCAIDSNKLPLLWERDQLNSAKNSESILDGFIEGPLNFPPTYKFDVGTHTYDTSAKKRKPAWTDRILWRLRRTGSPVPTHNASLQRGLTSWLGGATKVVQHMYRSHMGFTISDHKPVAALFSLQFPFRVDKPLVELQVATEWSNISDATVKFTVASTYQRSSWDWVAIYKAGFRHYKDYQAYVWAKGELVTQVSFAEEDLPGDDVEYILGYYSNNMNSIVGLSSQFKIKMPVHNPTVCRSDSSDASSEDDSTLVLLAPNSRSPSPKTGKRHHRHRRSHSPAVPALSSNPLPSLQGLGLGPRSKEGHVQSRSPCSSAKKERLVSPDAAPSPVSPLSPRSPVSPGCGVTVPEALIVAILGENSPAQISPTGLRQIQMPQETNAAKKIHTKS